MISILVAILIVALIVGVGCWAIKYFNMPYNDIFCKLLVGVGVLIIVILIIRLLLSLHGGGGGLDLNVHSGGL